jgi:hypothetical protein
VAFEQREFGIDYRMDKWGSISGRARGFIFHMMSHLGVWIIPFLIQWIPVALSSGKAARR